MRFSSEYELLESELAKVHSIHGTSQPDWQKVIDLGECLLRQHSKDLRVVVWLTWALHQRESFPGLLAGLGLLRDLCERHWAVVYPVKLRTRAAAFAWLVLRLEPLSVQNLPLTHQRPLFQAILEHLTRLDELWAGQLGEGAPLLLPIRRQLADRLERAAQGNPEPGAVAGVIAQLKQAATPLRSPELTVDSEKDAHKRLRALQDQARPLCAWWLRQDATDLRALRLGRTLAWLGLVSYPEADSERITSLRAPTPDRLKRYQERFEQGQYADLLLELDASLATALFWFDGVRRVWECLEALQAESAMAELEADFAQLLKRLPQLPLLRFHDGTPFADTATRDWIALHIERHLRKPEPPRVTLDAEGQPWELALQQAVPLLRKDGLKSAVCELRQGLHAAASDRARFQWRLAVARLCMLAGIRRSFFAEGQGDMQVRFTLTPYSLDQAVSRALLRIGDSQLEYRHGPIVPMAFQWPVTAANGRSSLVLERGAERPVGIEKNTGAWSWFRLVDLLQSEPAQGRDAQLLKSDLAGLRANFLLTSERSPSPFPLGEWRTFRLPEQL